ncbi:MAG: hypothetical protein KJ718_01685 [Nanoarchaeota archaeon]|nr:hypothetical protein [Nanoarchaeota archaeon]
MKTPTKKQIKFSAKELLALLKKSFDDFVKESPIYYDEHSLWWAWDDEKKFWSIVDDVCVLNLFEDFFDLKTEQVSKHSGFILKVLRQKSRRYKPLDLPEYCVQFKNKIYNLREKKELPATPKYFLTAPIPYELSKNSETPTIDRLFVEWVGEKYKPTLYEILAYSCLREQFLQTIVALTGAGSNGKGTFQNLIIKFLGKENCVASNIKSLITRSFETSALYKKLLCVVGEVDSADLTNTNLLKQLTGEDLIRYEFKGKTTFSELSPTTFIIATNSLPITPDKSDGFYRRILTIDFPNQFKLKRDLLAEIPEKEFHNLTRKVVDVLLRLIETNEFTNGGDIEERRRRYEERSNPLMMFVSQDYEEGGAGYVKLREFSNSFNDFLKQKKLRQLTVSKIGKLLRDEGFEVSTRKFKDETGEIIDSAKSIIGLTEKSQEKTKKIESHRIVETGGLGGSETTRTTESGYTPQDKIFCIKCKSNNVHAYSDMIFCDDCKHKEQLK